MRLDHLFTSLDCECVVKQLSHCIHLRRFAATVDRSAKSGPDYSELFDMLWDDPVGACRGAHVAATAEWDPRHLD